MKRLVLALIGACVALSEPRLAYADTTIAISGSAALRPLVQAAAEVYQGGHPDVRISVLGGGSSLGINQLVAKTVDVADSDTLALGHPELVDHRVAVVGFVVLTNPRAGVKNLTMRQLQDVFSGKTLNWKEVGGADVKIVVVNRPRNSGTRELLVKVAMGGSPIAESGVTESTNGTMVQTVKSNPGGISYGVFSRSQESGLIALAIDGFPPTDENIYAGSYPFWSYEHMFTNGPPTTEISRFLAFLLSNSTLFKAEGFLLIRDMKVTALDR